MWPFSTSVQLLLCCAPTPHWLRTCPDHPHGLMSPVGSMGLKCNQSIMSSWLQIRYLLSTYQAHRQAPLRRFLELGAGPARHSILLAREASADSTTVDLSPEMVAYAAQQATEADLGAGSINCLQADMCQPLPASLHSAVDLAAILLGSLAHCLDNSAALACFRQASSCLRPGGPSGVGAWISVTSLGVCGERGGGHRRHHAKGRGFSIKFG